MYEKKGTSIRGFSIITGASKVGEESTETRRLTSDIPNTPQCSSTTLLHFEHHIVGI